MNSNAILAISAAVLAGAVLGFLLGRYRPGGWLFAASLVLGLAAAGLMSSDLLSLLGISNQNWAHMAYAAFGMLILMPALAALIVTGGVGLWLAARARTPDGEG